MLWSRHTRDSPTWEKAYEFCFQCFFKFSRKEIKKNGIISDRNKILTMNKIQQNSDISKNSKEIYCFAMIAALKFNKLINRVKLDGGAASFLCAVHHGDHGATFLPFHSDIFFKYSMSMWWWSSVCPRVEWFRNLLKSVQWFSEFKSLSSNND